MESEKRLSKKNTSETILRVRISVDLERGLGSIFIWSETREHQQPPHTDTNFYLAREPPFSAPFCNKIYQIQNYLY